MNEWKISQQTMFNYHGLLVVFSELSFCRETAYGIAIFSRSSSLPTVWMGATPFCYPVWRYFCWESEYDTCSVAFFCLDMADFFEVLFWTHNQRLFARGLSSDLNILVKVSSLKPSTCFFLNYNSTICWWMVLSPLLTWVDLRWVA